MAYNIRGEVGSIPPYPTFIPPGPKKLCEAYKNKNKDLHVRNNHFDYKVFLFCFLQWSRPIFWVSFWCKYIHYKSSFILQNYTCMSRTTFVVENTLFEELGKWAWNISFISQCVPLISCLSCILF